MLYNNKKARISLFIHFDRLNNHQMCSAKNMERLISVKEVQEDVLPAPNLFWAVVPLEVTAQLYKPIKG
ncbi:hypothetical protein C7121_09030 [Paenibacillus glucanolyticus]|nr:hypothetical protein C7121_09030 [Paenibacillus glucanolyticus]